LRSQYVKLMHSFFCIYLLPPTSTLFPYTTLFRSTHDFHGMLRKYNIHRLDAIKWIGEKWAYPVDRLSARKILEVASSEKLPIMIDRKSTRLNSSHVKISYAVFCLKKKK